MKESKMTEKYEGKGEKMEKSKHKSMGDGHKMSDRFARAVKRSPGKC